MKKLEIVTVNIILLNILIDVRIVFFDSNPIT